MPPYYVIQGLEAEDIPKQHFSRRTVFALSFLGLIATLSYVSVMYMPRKATWRDRYAWIWLVRFDLPVSCVFRRSRVHIDV